MKTVQTLQLAPATLFYPIVDQRQLIWENRLDSQFLKFVKKWVDLKSHNNLILLSDAESILGFLPNNNGNGNGQAIANHAIEFKRLNEFHNLNQHLRSINEKIENGGVFVGQLETSFLRKARILKSYPLVLNRVIYFFDYFIFRVWPKLPGFRHLFFRILPNRGRAIPEMEVLGRLYFSGFTLLDTQESDGAFYFAVKKSGPPEYDEKPNCGPLIRLRRKGGNGKIIHVYKLRTMFTYAQFLQQHVYERNGLETGGKMKKDPRVNAVGFVLRKFWLDEVPMIANLLKGDLKLVGVRPLSTQYLGLYPAEAQAYREKFKPGLIPPFYADLPKTLDEIVASEMRYLQAYQRRPFLTDFKVLCKAFYNIVFRMVRSK